MQLIRNDFEVKRLNYSRAPWRIVHKDTGKEVRTEQAEMLPGAYFPVPGYDRKCDAVAALDRFFERVQSK